MRSSHCPAPPYKELLPSAARRNKRGLLGKVETGTGHQSPKRPCGLAVVQKSQASPGHECQKLSLIARVCQHVLTANWSSPPVRGISTCSSSQSVYPIPSRILMFGLICLLFPRNWKSFWQGTVPAVRNEGNCGCWSSIVWCKSVNSVHDDSTESLYWSKSVNQSNRQKNKHQSSEREQTFDSAVLCAKCPSKQQETVMLLMVFCHNYVQFAYNVVQHR